METPAAYDIVCTVAADGEVNDGEGVVSLLVRWCAAIRSYLTWCG